MAARVFARMDPRHAMKVPIYSLFFLLLCAALATVAPAAVADSSRSAAAPRFALFYSSRDDAALSEFDVLVLDADDHPNIARIRQRARHKQIILGYLSLCELGPGKTYKADLMREGLILGPNPRWPGSFYLDIRRPAWHERVVKQIAPALIAQGFDGLFLDTLDDAPWLESEAPAGLRAPGMSDAAVALVRALRAQFPGRPIMMNRGFDLINRLAPQVDMILAESTYARWSEVGHAGTLVAPAEHASLVRQLSALRVRHPNVQIFTLDYWDENDAAGIARIYCVQRALGFVPYVATRELNVIVPEPRG
jgi:uncharacterized protein (TIGR01370 family)